MEVKETNLREVGSFLRNAELSGWNWVAFSSLPNDIPPVFEGFISAAEAQAFCYANDVSRSYPYEDDPYAVREKYLDYRFMPVETLRQSYQGMEGLLRLLFLKTLSGRLWKANLCSYCPVSL